MKKLPYKFQFRHCAYAGHTHTAKMNAHGDYEVQWARGWANVVRAVPNVVFDSNLAKELIEAGSWQLVDDKPKQAELPDHFYFKVPRGEVYRFAKINDHKYMCHALKDDGDCAPWGVEEIKQHLQFGTWTMVSKPLTAEQQKQLKEFREQVAQLEQSIKLNQQDICHKERLVANYEQRKNDVLSKIAELEDK